MCQPIKNRFALRISFALHRSEFGGRRTTHIAVLLFASVILAASSRVESSSPELAVDETFYFTNHLALVRAEINSVSFEESLNRDALALLPSDFLTNLFDEIRSPVFKELVTEEVGTGGSRKRLPEFRVHVCVQPDWVDIWFATGSRQDRDAFGRFAQRARFYVRARGEGHSSNYVYWAIEESKGTNYILPPGFPPSFKSRYWIPSQWIDPTNVWNWRVVDGKFAWTYHPEVERRDAQEYDSKRKAQFAAAREEAVQNLKARGQFLEPNIIDMEVKRILKQRYKIDWLTPQELRLFEL